MTHYRQSARPFGPSNKKGTCLWCGLRLRWKYDTKHAYIRKWNQPTECYYCSAGKEATWTPIEGEPDRFTCDNCDNDMQGRQKRKVVSRTKRKGYEKPGDYGDGHFCGLRCAYDFAVAVANNGRRLNPTPEHRED